jgi:hypothetical protein
MFGLTSARSLVKRWLHRLHRDTNRRRTTERLAFAPDGRETRSGSAAVDRGPRAGTQTSSDGTSRYTLQAVCEWYDAFLHETILEEATQDQSSAGTAGAIRVLPRSERRSSVPGFPNAVRQTLTHHDKVICARFFDARGHEVGRLEMWRESDAWLIESADGVIFRVRQVATAADLKLHG